MTEDELKKEITAQVLVVPFPDLEPHLKRGAVILVSDSLSLEDTAFAMAQNQVQEVEQLIEDKLLTRPGEDAVEAWRDEKAFFKFVIIQPYVIAQKYVELADK